MSWTATEPISGHMALAQLLSAAEGILQELHTILKCDVLLVMKVLHEVEFVRMKRCSTSQYAPSCKRAHEK